MAWPKRGARFDRASREDSANAAASRPAFARVTRIVGGAVQNGRLVVVAHSMGGQVVGEALELDTELRTSLAVAPLRTVDFVVPDVAARHFAVSNVPGARESARRVMLYASSRDHLLSLARYLDGFDRAGRVGDSAIVRPGLETVDVTDDDFERDGRTGYLGCRTPIAARSGQSSISRTSARASCRLSVGDAGD